MAIVASPSAAGAASVPPPPCPPPPPQFHVLAVDDSLLDRKLIEGLLRTSSYHVTAVDSVTKALEFLGMQQQGGAGATAPVPSCSYCCHQREINLIITDYCMPGMTGYDLLKTVKGSGSPLRDIPVVIMSSENVPARINRCLEEGADDFFLKPVKLSDVSKLRPHLLRGKSTPNATNDQHDRSQGNIWGKDMQEQPLRKLEMDLEQACGSGGDDADLTATDSPRSNKRKAAPQGGGDSILHDQRTRTTMTTSSSSFAVGYALPLA